MGAEDLVEAASGVRSEYATAADEVRADASLSERGKADRLAELHTKSAERLRSMETASDAADAELHARSEATVYSPGRFTGADAISFRDALDRAEKAGTIDQKRDLLARAARTGDEHLERAVFSTVLDQRLADPVRGDRWDDVIDEYIARHPSERAAVANLLDASVNRRRAFENRIARSMLFRLEKPDELKGRRS